LLNEIKFVTWLEVSCYVTSQASSGIQPPSCSIGTRDSVPEEKEANLYKDHPPPTSAMIRASPSLRNH